MLHLAKKKVVVPALPMALRFGPVSFSYKDEDGDRELGGGRCISFTLGVCMACIRNVVVDTSGLCG